MFGIKVKQYSDLTYLLENEKLDAVSICTPSELHSKQVRQCLKYNLHILCEKPFVFDSLYENYKIAQNLIKMSKEKRKVLTVNMQWPSVLDILSIKKGAKINNFSMYMEPPGFKKTAIISDAIPHMNSMLIRLVGGGEVTNFRFHKSEKDLRIKFDYKNNQGICNVTYYLKPKQERPRTINFSINGEKYQRVATDYYKQKITNGKKKLK